MINQEQLNELRLKEKQLVESIRDKIQEEDQKCKIAYLPNITPNKKVKYIFITMEPSFGRWAKDETDAEEMVQNGFRNFIFDWDIQVFRYSIAEFLDPSYYVTDISKAAMRVTDANLWRNDIWPQWIDLLKEEIEIVGKDDCEIIFVGKNVENFLRSENLNRNVLKTVLHYSGQAAKQRKRIPQEYPKEFTKFKENLSSDVILRFAKNFLEQNALPTEMKERILRGLENNKTKLSESRKKLIFTYYREFKEIIRPA